MLGRRLFRIRAGFQQPGHNQSTTSRCPHRRCPQPCQSTGARMVGPVHARAAVMLTSRCAYTQSPQGGAHNVQPAHTGSSGRRAWSAARRTCTTAPHRWCRSRSLKAEPDSVMHRRQGRRQRAAILFPSMPSCWTQAGRPLQQVAGRSTRPSQTGSRRCTASVSSKQPATA